MQYTLSTLPAVAAEVGDIMDAREVGGDGVGAGPASNEKSTCSLHAHM